MKRVIFAACLYVKKNPSGVISVRVIDKSRGKYRVIPTIGSSFDACDIEKLYKEGKKCIDVRCGNCDVFTILGVRKGKSSGCRLFVEKMLPNGTQLIIN
jgi:hypothetical protein